MRRRPVGRVTVAEYPERNDLTHYSRWHIPPVSVVQKGGKHMPDGSVTVERPNKGRTCDASGGERADQTAEEYTAASFLELPTS